MLQAVFCVVPEKWSLRLSGQNGRDMTDARLGTVRLSCQPHGRAPDLGRTVGAIARMRQDFIRAAPERDSHALLFQLISALLLRPGIGLPAMQTRLAVPGKA